jgi:predicted AlkP superfamily phosphohydrolase/phosphomutase
MCSALQINRNHENYLSLRDKLKEELKKVLDPSGSSVFKGVWTNEELYKGDRLEDLPDIFFLANPDYEIDYNPYTDTWPEPSDALPGDHFNYPEGILVLKGEGIKKKIEIENATIYDLAPTILYLMDLEVPGDMDGKVLTDAIDPSYLKENPVRYTGMRDIHPRIDEKVFTEEEKEEIKDRLRSLGYL